MSENCETIIQNLELRLKEQDKQIYDLKLRNLEFKVKEQDEQINGLLKMVSELYALIGINNLYPERTIINHLIDHEQVIGQLLSGLFCKRTQVSMYNRCNDVLSGNYDSYENEVNSEPDIHPSGIWPTTRQGDQHQKKIVELEARLEALER
jgi:hypothetical protein